MLANPARIFARPRVPVTALTARPYESRNVGILPVSMALRLSERTMLTAAQCGCKTYFTRAKVIAAVERGEMRWVDRYHNVATYTEPACGTWQKTRSGEVCTMQLKNGQKGRYVPLDQREPEMAAA